MTILCFTVDGQGRGGFLNFAAGKFSVTLSLLLAAYQKVNGYSTTMLGPMIGGGAKVISVRNSSSPYGLASPLHRASSTI